MINFLWIKKRLYHRQQVHAGVRKVSHQPRRKRMIAFCALVPKHRGFFLFPAGEKVRLSPGTNRGQVNRLIKSILIAQGLVHHGMDGSGKGSGSVPLQGAAWPVRMEDDFQVLFRRGLRMNEKRKSVSSHSRQQAEA